MKIEVREEEIKTALRGDEETQFAGICKAYDTYADSLAAYLRERYPFLDSHELTTAVNDVFVDLAEKAKKGSFTMGGSLRSLLFRMAQCNAIDQVRQKYRWQERNCSEQFRTQDKDGKTVELTDDEVASLVVQKLSKGPERIAQQNGYVRRTKAGDRVGFVPGHNIDKIDRYTSRYPVCAAVDWVVGKFRYSKTDELELLATVDFAVLDLIRQRAAITMENVKHVIATNKDWTAKLKREIFSDSNITRALVELRTLFPDTYAQEG